MTFKITVTERPYYVLLKQAQQSLTERQNFYEHIGRIMKDPANQKPQ